MADGPMHRLLRVVRRIAEPDAGLPSDERLLDRFVATRDEAAFELLVRRHGAMVLGVCRRALRDEHAAEDAFQATFCVLARKARSVTNVTSFLYGVARRVSANERRKAARRVWHERRAAVAELVVAGDDRTDLRAVLDEELDRLPARLRLPAVLCYLEGHSTAEAARQIGCPRGTVLSRLAAARLRLKVRLTRRGLALPAGGLAALAGAADAPAALIAPTVRAALAFAAGRVILGGAAAPHVITLAEGVLRAMFVSKLTMTAAVLVAVGLAGTGAGWVAWPTVGSGAVIAEAPQAKTKAAQPEPRPDDAQPRNAQEQSLRALQNELKMLTVRLADLEGNLTREQSQARFRLVDAEERLRQVQREQEFERGLEMARIKAAEDQVLSAQAAMNTINEAGVDSSHPDARRATLKIEVTVSYRKNLLDARVEKEAQRLEQLIQARQRAIEADEIFQRRVREADDERRQTQMARGAIHLKLLQVQHGSPNITGPDTKLDELERKINDLLREVKDLRRDMRK